MRGERLAFDELEHQGAGVMLLVDSIDRRDVRVIDSRQRASFPREPREAIGIRSKRRRKDLDRHFAPELQVARSIDLAHPTGPKETGDFECADACPSFQRHSAGRPRTADGAIGRSH